LLDERIKEHQKIIQDFLRGKDPQKTLELKRAIEHDGQRDGVNSKPEGQGVADQKLQKIHHHVYQQELFYHRRDWWEPQSHLGSVIGL